MRDHSLTDFCQNDKSKPNDKIIFKQGDLYTITWEANFDEHLNTRGKTPSWYRGLSGEAPVTSNDGPHVGKEDRR